MKRRRKPSVYRKIRGIRDDEIRQSITALQNQITEVKQVVGALVAYVNRHVVPRIDHTLSDLPGDFTVEGAVAEETIEAGQVDGAENAVADYPRYPTEPFDDGA